MFVAKKQDTNLEAQSGALYASPAPDFAMGTFRQRNRVKPPGTCVIGLKEWIGHVRCKKTRRNFGSTKWCIVCTPGTRLRNGYLSATESRETTRKMSYRPKEVDWSCPLRKNKTKLWKHKVVHCMHPRHLTSQRVPFGNGITRNHPEYEF